MIEKKKKKKKIELMIDMKGVQIFVVIEEEFDRKHDAIFEVPLEEGLCFIFREFFNFNLILFYFNSNICLFNYFYFYFYFHLVYLFNFINLINFYLIFYFNEFIHNNKIK